MREEALLKIGEFARLGQVSIATLRHYDQFGLLKPVMLDSHTGYRYYSLAQLPRLHRIMTLKDLGFPLPEIARLLDQNLSLEQLQAFFQLKQAHIQEVIVLEQARLARVAARLRQIEQEGSMPVYEMLLKKVEPLLVATMRKQMRVGEDIARDYGAILAYTNPQGVARHSPLLLLWYSRFQVREDGMYADVELAVPLQTMLPGNAQINVRTLPGGLVVSTVHQGHTLSLGHAHMALHRWLEENHYRLSGPPRQVRHRFPETPGASSAITEVQFPVELQEV